MRQTLILSIYQIICNAWIPQEHKNDFKSKVQQWDQFKKTFGKTYKHDVEWQNAFAFEINHEKIATLNAKQLSQGKDLRFEVNQYADMTQEQFIAVRGGQKGSKPAAASYESQNGAPLAESVDWRKKSGVLAAVQDQGSCGSCWAFSATCAMESGQAISSGNSVVKLSEQELVNCEKPDQGCNGGLPDNAFAWAEKNGMTTENKIPQTGEDGTCKQDKKDAKIFVDSQVDVEKTDEAIKAAVAKQPLSIGVDANPWQFYSSGVMTFEQCPAGDLDHGVVMVGQDSKGWIVRNSWGNQWGENGYIQLEMGKNTCGFRENASYPTFKK